jgi:hypothetical protein
VIKNIFIFIFLLSAGLGSCQITNNPKPLASACDSIILKVGDNWKYSNKHNISNPNFIKALVKNKACFVGKDSLEIDRIFGINHTLMIYKKGQNALYYNVTFNKESGVALLFVLDNNGRLEEIDTVYFDAGFPVK